MPRYCRDATMTARLSLFVFVLVIASTCGCGTDNQCLNKECVYDGANPRCTGGCDDGWSGSFCELICLNRCEACAQNNSSTCTKCGKGRYGGACEKRCDACKDHQCYRNGTCVLLHCPIECRSGSCDKTGECMGGCKGDFYGRTCNRSCPANCRKCDELGCRICDDKTGSCFNCTDGFTGDKCQERVCPYKSAGPRCEINCTLICEECNKTNPGTPVCLDIDLCQDSCLKDTLPSPCDCPDNCLQCDGCGTCEKCAQGWYTSNCSKSCSECKDMVCGQDGRCVDGCTEGYTGSMCHVPNSQSDIWSLILHLAKTNDLFLPLIVCSLVLFAAITGILIWRCKRKKNDRSPSREDSQCSFIRREKVEYPEIAKCGDIYHEIDDKDLDTVVSPRQGMLSERPRLPSPQSRERHWLPPPQHASSTYRQQDCAVTRKMDYMTAVEDILITGNSRGSGSRREAGGHRATLQEYEPLGDQDIPLDPTDGPKHSGKALGGSWHPVRGGIERYISADEQGYLTPKHKVVTERFIHMDEPEQTELTIDLHPSSSTFKKNLSVTNQTSGHQTLLASSSSKLTSSNVRLSCEF